MNLTADQDRRGECPVADPLLRGRGLSGQGVLVDHGHPLDNVSVHGHGVAGMDDDDVAFLERLCKDLYLDTVTVQPGITGLFAEGVKQHPLGVFARLLHEASPEAQTPATNRSRENRHCSEAPGHGDRIQGIHSESFLFQENPSRLLERGDR